MNLFGMLYILHIFLILFFIPNDIQTNFYAYQLILLCNLDHSRCWSHNIFTVIKIRLEKLQVDHKPKPMTIITRSSMMVTYL